VESAGSFFDPAKQIAFLEEEKSSARILLCLFAISFVDTNAVCAKNGRVEMGIQMK
jgi:hypothetical protein